MTMFGSQWFAAPDTTYEIDQSIRFNDNDSAHLSRTPGSAGNRRTWTFSAWVKRSNLGTRQIIFSSAGGAYLQLGPDAASTEAITLLNEGSGTDLNWYTDQVFRDTAAFFHVVWQFDSTQASEGNRTKLFINGSQVTDFTKASTPDQDFEGAINNTVEHKIGEGHIANFYLDAYLAEIHFIDGTAKEASDFGETNSDTGQWIPKAYSGSYGNQGFYIKGQDSSALGDDTSGNGNDFASSGLAAADQVSDSPTNNHCTLNVLNKDTDCTLTDGNLQVGWTSGTDPIICGTMAVSSGKWYYEATFTGTFNFPAVGIAPAELSFGGSAFASGNGALFYYAPSGNYRGNGDNVSYGAEYFVSSKIGVALNLDDNEITFYKDNSSQGTLNLATIRSGYSTWVPLLTGGGSVENIIVNFGQSDFEYTPPTNFNAWSVSNLADPAIADPSKYFHTQLYSGNGSSGHAITNDANAGNFKPDWLVLSPRSNGDHHNSLDAVRGSDKRIQTNNDSAEQTDDPALVTFESNGFDLDTTDVNYNGSGRTYAAWQWSTDGASAATNSDGDIDSSVMKNTTAGFSIVTYTGGGSTETYGHGLGAKPAFIVTKRRSGTENWWAWHQDLAGETSLLYMDLTNSATTRSVSWAPTSSTIQVYNSTAVGASSDTYVSYVFTEIDGYSKFGSYTGNGSSTAGPFVNTGFRPALVIIRTTGTNDWIITDNKRSPFNVCNQTVFWNATTSETTGYQIDMLSNGFRPYTTAAAVNGSGSTYVYLAFAESPFKTANAR